MINRSLICLIVTFFFLLHSVGKIEIPLLNKLEHNIYDLKVKLTTINTLDPRIIILDIDEKSLAQEGRWPWSRDKLSYLVDILFDYYHVKVLGFDVVFSEPDTSSGLELLRKLNQNELSDNIPFNQTFQKLSSQLDFDQLFANSLQNRSIVMGYYFNGAESHVNPSSSLPPPISLLDSYPQLKLIKAKGYGANLASLQDAAPRGGYFSNSNVDSDGSFRRLPLVTVYDNKIYESLSLAIYRELLGQPEIHFGFKHDYGNSNLESLDIESLSIPVTDHAIALVPYRGKQGSFKYISVTDVLNGESDLEELENKIVIMGTTAAGLLDLRTTPVQNLYAGVEVHANLVSGMLDNTFKSKPSIMIAFELTELILLSLLVIFLYPKLSSITSVITFSLIISFLIWLNMYLWNESNIDNFIATPLILLFILFSIQLYFGYFLETKKRNKLGKIFGQYIPEELVADMSHSDHEFSLQGESKEMSVLFSDVRNFTSISEKRTPDELCELINEILTPITKVIHHNHGTIDKYIGDAVMAFWGAPLDDENHAHNSILAALGFIPVLEEINTLFRQKDWPYIDIGIGINTGIMNVGNMGSEFRIAYTVMGDSVNLGARLEGLTKQYGVRIIVSEFTKNAAPDFSYLELDRVKVKGKNEPVRIYEPISLTKDISVSSEQEIIDFHSALTFYLQQNWSDAQSILKSLQQQNPDKFLYQLYLDRITGYQSSPPEPDWDGVFTHLTK